MNFILGILFSLIIVHVLALIPLVGVGTAPLVSEWVSNPGYAYFMRYVFGVVIPYAAITIFILGVIYRVFKWSFSPNPCAIA